MKRDSRIDPAAADDISYQIARITRGSPQNAVAFLEAVYDELDLLADNPDLATRVATPAGRDDYRKSVFHKSFVMYIRVEPDLIEVVRVRHVREDRGTFL